MRHFRSLLRVPRILIGREEEYFFNMGDKSCHTQEIAGIECGKRYEFNQMPFFRRSFSHKHDNRECHKIEKEADDVAHREYLHNLVGMFQNQDHDIDNPDEVEYEVVKDSL